MQLEQTGRTPKITLSEKYSTKQQFILALAVNIIPLMGAMATIVISVKDGIYWWEIALLMICYFLPGVGITVGYHRLFAHRTFQTSKGVQILLMILGAMACQGPLLYWASNHRRHHQYSDRPWDPHSPHCRETDKLNRLQGFWHAHVNWVFTNKMTNVFLFAKDLLKDSTIVKVNRLYYIWVLLGLAIPTAIGGIIEGTTKGLLLGFLWGGCLRLFLSSHFTWSINSITHLYGNRPFNNQDWSSNNIWLALPTLGEAWHNNHHAFPNSAKFGLKFWQVDLGYWTIRVLEGVGLVSNVKVPNAEAIAAKAKNS